MRSVNTRYAATLGAFICVLLVALIVVEAARSNRVWSEPLSPALSIGDCFGEDAQQGNQKNALPCQSFDADLYESLDYDEDSAAYADIVAVEIDADENHLFVMLTLNADINTDDSHGYGIEVDVDPGDEIGGMNDGSGPRADNLFIIENKEEFFEPDWQDALDAGGKGFYDGNDDVGGIHPRTGDPDCGMCSESNGDADGYEEDLDGPFQARINGDQVEFSLPWDTMRGTANDHAILDGRPVAFRVRASTKQSSSLSKDKLYYHDAQNASDLSGDLFDNTAWLSSGLAISIEQTSPGPVVVGESVSFEIEIANTLGSPLQDMTISHLFDPSLLAYESASVEPLQVNGTDGEVLWQNLEQTLADGEFGTGDTITLSVTFTTLAISDGTPSQVNVEASDGVGGLSIGEPGSVTVVLVEPTATPTPTATPGQSDSPLPTPTQPGSPLATPTPTSTPAPTITPTPIVLPNGWHRRTDVEAGYTIEYPANSSMTAGKNKGEPYDIVYINFILPGVRGYQALVIDVLENQQELSIEQYADDLYEQVYNRSAPPGLILDTVTIGDISGYQINFMPGRTNIQVLIPYGDKVYILALVHGRTYSRSADEAVELFWEAVATFTILP